MSSKFPLVVILSDIAVQLRARSMVLNLGWAPRDQHEEADALTNGEFAQFDGGRRIEVDVGKVGWLVLPRMLEVSENIYSEVQRKKADRGHSPARAPATQQSKSLRQRDPW